MTRRRDRASSVVAAFLLAALTLLVSTSAGARGVEAWAITWDQDPNNVNPITLCVDEGRLRGEYRNDAGAVCEAVGLQERNGFMSLTILCPDWEIRIDGRFTADRLRAQGDYRAYIGASGRFSMARAPLTEEAALRCAPPVS